MRRHDECNPPLRRRARIGLAVGEAVRQVGTGRKQEVVADPRVATHRSNRSAFLAIVLIGRVRASAGLSQTKPGGTLARVAAKMAIV